MIRPLLIALALTMSAGQAFSAPTKCSAKMDQPECEMWTAINKVRARYRLPLLGLNDRCVDAAEFHARHMADKDFFSHDAPRETWSRRMDRFDLEGSGVGENIAWGNGVVGTVKAWMKSPGHRRNILQRRYKSTGIGMALGDSGRKIWVQCFTALPAD